MIIVRIPKRISNRWIAKHRKDGLDEYKLVHFIETQYILGSFERVKEDLLFLSLIFRRRGHEPLKASLWVRERKVNGLTELILIRAHVERL